jgi:type II restriction enzyme
MDDQERIKYIFDALPRLSSFQVESIARIIAQLNQPRQFWRSPESDLISDEILQDFGDALRLHHVFSAEALSKDRFEYALERVLKRRGIPATLAGKGNPGHDITIRNVAVSLKTQADSSIKGEEIAISKFMELGKGEWDSEVEQLRGLLLQRVFPHMEKYERIFTLRRLKHATQESYELVEIPKALLLKAKDGHFEMMMNSRQNPKPGYCTVLDGNAVAFKFYFDGGTERKLQVRHLNKALCRVHATWNFPRQEADEARRDPQFDANRGS